MARRELYIPWEVKQNIAEHITKGYQHAKDGFYSSSEDEDSLTGDFGSSLRIKNQKVSVKQQEVGNKEWSWSMDYTKFRGRGPGATESKLGADGIFELTINDGGSIQKKSLLFQAKTELQKDPRLLEEALKLTTWREAAFILNFTPNEYEAISLDEIIKSRGKKNSTTKTKPIDKYIGEDFLNCLVGDIDLKYNAHTRKLVWKSISGEIVATKFSIPERISINISSSTPDSLKKYEKEIKNDEIHKYRMDASPEDILSVKENSSDTKLKEARRAKAMIYHPDSFNFGNFFLNELAKKRMQESNDAYDRLKKNNK